MFNSITDKAEREEGFTLIELMVVVLIIGILMAIAIPTFLGAKNSANGRAAQSNVRNAVTAEASIFANNQTYDGTLAGEKSAEGNLQWAGQPAAGAAFTAGNVYVQADAASTAATQLMITALGKDNQCYSALLQGGQNYFAQAAATTVAGGGYTCATPANASFKTSFGGPAPTTAPATQPTWVAAA